MQNNAPVPQVPNWSIQQRPIRAHAGQTEGIYGSMSLKMLGENVPEHEAHQACCGLGLQRVAYQRTTVPGHPTSSVLILRIVGVRSKSRVSPTYFC